MSNNGLGLNLRVKGETLQDLGAILGEEGLQRELSDLLARVIQRETGKGEIAENMRAIMEEPVGSRFGTLTKDQKEAVEKLESEVWIRLQGARLEALRALADVMGLEVAEVAEKAVDAALRRVAAGAEELGGSSM